MEAAEVVFALVVRAVVAGEDDQGLFRQAELSERVGISITNLSLLKTGKVKGIRFSTLEAICRELQCQPGDILEHIPEFV